VIGLKIPATLQASLQVAFPVESLIFEMSEGYKLTQYARVVKVRSAAFLVNTLGQVRFA
jgi:hypothetical protein